MIRLRVRAALALLALAALLTGCGSTTVRAQRQRTPASTARAATGPNAAAVTVIRDWSDALRAGHVGAAAKYFSLPSVFANGEVLIIHSERQAIIANASLSCGAEPISVTKLGSLFHVIFRLTDRSGLGGGCGSGIGEEGAADIIIAHGQISHWLRAPIHERSAPKAQPTPAVSQTPATPV